MALRQLTEAAFFLLTDRRQAEKNYRALENTEQAKLIITWNPFACFSSSS